MVSLAPSYYFPGVDERLFADTSLPGGHFDAYVKGFETSSAAALAWFREHLAD